MGGRFKREGTYIYLWLIHVDVWQKSTQYCKAIILHLKVNKLFKIIFTQPWWESKYRRKRVDRSCPREQLNFKVKERLKLQKLQGQPCEQSALQRRTRNWEEGERETPEIERPQSNCLKEAMQRRFTTQGLSGWCMRSAADNEVARIQTDLKCK